LKAEIRLRQAGLGSRIDEIATEVRRRRSAGTDGVAI
jgi:hypothetical protein